MPRIRHFLLLPAAGIGVAAAILSAPIAAADETGTNSQLPQCETVSGDSISGGQTEECATPGNTELNATPQQFPGEEEFWGFPAFGFW
ncbi:hypothetical protein ORI20_25630 [Mycobacterium sp. CVI_P3]|uniref:Uncharacterized protein n=1 Tax=Mycobacterium pinniadriaticum TaxID=2994102 RepID=A0ABT3SML1_9MYCO|nr:hypothetical protein [Mycobacterium pinniadriaticum]MCX2933656.1 hypothetical protein [Mycobacterium pinniadriaticum]MCX2940057.1 hypothetical protein [Mycobacterium pinniadriaticum]